MVTEDMVVMDHKQIKASADNDLEGEFEVLTKDTIAFEHRNDEEMKIQRESGTMAQGHETNGEGENEQW